jgi:hypothetical protein
LTEAGLRYKATSVTDTPILCDLFIRTYPGDAAYHEKCLASIDKFCTGFRNTVVVNKTDRSPRIGYLQQQVDKLHADTCTDADYVLITDSDTLFVKPVTPETYFRDGKPIWLHTPWTPEMLASDVTVWYEVMRNFSGVAPTSEFMRRQPFMLPAWLLKDLRQWCVFQHTRALADYVMNSGRFSEFNVLGHHAWRFHHNRFHWIDTSKDELPELTVRQFWSHDPIEKNLEEINRILA